jgi:DNA-binding IclR family transcriptional regulator
MNVAMNVAAPVTRMSRTDIRRIGELLQSVANEAAPLLL